jgi:uncharacterized cupin superfamily protein
VILRKDAVPTETQRSDFGTVLTTRLSAAGGLTQYGAHVQTLLPGTRASLRHWHEREDEFLYVLSGEVTITEDDGDHVLGPGDAAAWPAGVANAHTACNRGSAPATYLIVGTRVSHDVCHYPDERRTLHTEGSQWRLLDDTTGAVIRSGS